MFSYIMWVENLIKWFKCKLNCCCKANCTVGDFIEDVQEGIEDVSEIVEGIEDLIERFKNDELSNDDV